MKCRLCQNESVTIKSHIIAEGFFRFLYPENRKNQLLVLVPAGSKFVKRRPVGSYVQNILCQDCDNALGVYDEYAQNIFLNNFPELHSNSDQLFLLKNIDYHQLKYFCLSLLWRASVSSLEEFKSINIGRCFEEILRVKLLEKNFIPAHEFPVFVTKIESKNSQALVDKSIELPSRGRIDHVNFCLFYLPNGYNFFIKVDSRALPKEFNYILLKPGEPLIILKRSFDDSSQFMRPLKFINYLRSKK